ncbi:MAG: c-type cytochrome [Aromatoleum sp.]|jgi:mono/diheme cytochrome c family protein|uniref:c-type cytochrome n=1 Tax=Aromatoleum sp. TaxID=2307007 RepID=UPI000ADE8173|nr:c-type cytochrome [Aromatoleum sp.]KAI5911932.1 c-type cytochrome [Azoarcus sp. PA01]KON82670.2 c-type cytochrome [Azoarcus sp. PA01]MDT3671732.1 c-type cytochrome [Aromatoleum sp.]
MMKNLLGACAAMLIMIASCPVGASGQTGAERGQAVFQEWCVSCHGTGPGHPGTQALDLRYQGSLPGALEQRLDLTPETVEAFVRNGISVMPFFRKTEISDAELDALGAYLSRNNPH